MIDRSHPLGLTLIVLLLGFTGSSAADDRPNVLLIISDDQAWGDYGFMGHENIQTPHLDALAASGTLFTRGYVPTSLCRPSLATLVSGLYPHQHRITGNDPPRGTPRGEMLTFIDEMETLPERLATVGYRSLQTGKWWEGNHARGGFTHGMTHGDPKRRGRHGDEGLTIGRKGLKPVEDFITEVGDDPYFIWYAPFLPHTPHNPPKRLLDKYQEPGRPEPIAKYHAMCEWFDETCGELLALIDAKKRERETLVILVTDNGWIQRPDRNGFAPRSKRSPYEGGVRTPIVVRWTGSEERPAPAPARVSTPVSSIDIVPTILASCGVEVPDSLPGVDLLPVATGKVSSRPIFGASFTHDVVELGVPARSMNHRWVVEGRWKLIHHSDPKKSPELYDVIADPAEKSDRFEKEPDRADALLRVLDAWWAPKP